MELLNREAISPVFWEPYIINGYRRTNTSLWECIKYVFVLHNDFGNFWSHFIVIWIWLYWLYRLSFQLDFTDPFWYPLITIWISGCGYVLGSSVAHGLSTKSILTRQICFMMDYHGISLYSFGAGIAYYFYERPLNDWVFEHKWCYVVLNIAVTVMATPLSSLSRFYGRRWRYWLRVGSFVAPYIVASCPFWGRFYTCWRIGESCIDETLPLHYVTLLISYIVPLLFVMKLPERLAPGKFDYFFHSHQLFHVAAVAGTSLQFYVLFLDSIARRNELSTDPYYFPTLYSTFVPFAIVFVSGSLIVAVMGVLLHTGCLKLSNKLDINPQQKLD